MKCVAACGNPSLLLVRRSAARTSCSGAWPLLVYCQLEKVSAPPRFPMTALSAQHQAAAWAPRMSRTGWVICLSCWVKQVVEGAKFIGRSSKPEDCCLLTVRALSCAVGSNFCTRREKRLEFSDFFLEVSRFLYPGCDRHLYVTTGGTAVIHQTPVNQEQSEQPPDIRDIQKAFPRNFPYIRVQHAFGVRIHPYS